MDDELVFCEYDPTQENKYVWAVCECSDVTHGVRIERKKEDCYFIFNCPKCGKELGIMAKGTDSDCKYFIVV